MPRGNLAAQRGGAAMNHIGNGSTASSAAKNKRAGISEDVLSFKVFIPGEGWVRWTEIEQQVAQAYDQWRKRCSLEGRHVYDFAEAQASDIAEAKARRT
jgi:hypothetical protein